MVVNRLEERTKRKKIEKNVNIHKSIFEVIEKISDEVVRNHRDLISDITLGKSPKSALELVILKTINHHNYQVENTPRNQLIREVMDYTLGYGMIQKYLNMEDCSGIFINGPANAWVKIGKNMEQAPDIDFGTNDNLRSYIRTTIQANLKGEINENKALAKFEDPINKLRIVCAIEPVAHISPIVVFRKHRGEAFTVDDLIEIGMLPREMANELIRYARAGANVILCGSGGAGKTTLMRALLEEITPELRILLMEEHAECFLKHPNAIQLLVKRNAKGEIISMKEITDMGLLMSIDVYAFGEIRGAESLYFFDGAYNGNITWSTSHAGSARKALKKLMINMKKSGTDLPEGSLMDMLYESVNIIIYLDKFTVREVVEVVAEAEGKFKFNDLWKFEVTNRQATFIQGEHKKIGKLKSEGLINKLYENNLLKEGEADLETVNANDHRVIHISRPFSRDQ